MLEIKNTGCKSTKKIGTQDFAPLFFFTFYLRLPEDDPLLELGLELELEPPLRLLEPLLEVPLLVLLLGRLTLLLLPVRPLLEPLLVVPLLWFVLLLGRLTLPLLPVRPLLEPLLVVPLLWFVLLLGRLTLPLLLGRPLLEPLVPLLLLWFGAGGLTLPLLLLPLVPALLPELLLPWLMLPEVEFGRTVAFGTSPLPPLLGAGGLSLFQLGEPG